MAQKITFTLPSETVGHATSALLLGTFNNWDYSNAISLTKQEDGSLKGELELEAGTYEYRYLLNDGRWVNDNKADAYVINPEFGENCVVTVSAPAKKVAAPAKKAAPVKEEATPVVATEAPAAPAAPAPAKKAAAKKAAIATAVPQEEAIPAAAPKKAAAKKASKK